MIMNNSRSLWIRAIASKEDFVLVGTMICRVKFDLLYTIRWDTRFIFIAHHRHDCIRSYEIIRIVIVGFVWPARAWPQRVLNEKFQHRSHQLDTLQADASRSFVRYRKVVWILDRCVCYRRCGCMARTLSSEMMKTVLLQSKYLGVHGTKG